MIFHFFGASCIFGCSSLQSVVPGNPSVAINSDIAPVFFQLITYKTVLQFSDPSCPAFINMTVPVAFQLTQLAEATSGLPMWVGSGNQNYNVNNYNQACITQVAYLANYGVLEEFQPPTNNPAFKHCVLDATVRMSDKWTRVRQCAHLMRREAQKLLMMMMIMMMLLIC
jgi:hypothetical protein